MRYLSDIKNKMSNYRKPILVTVALLLTLTCLATITELYLTYSYYAHQLDVKLKNQVLNLPNGLYAAPRRVSIGQQISEIDLAERLFRAGYQQGVQAGDFATGSFELRENAVNLYTREFARQEQLPETVLISFTSGKTAKKGGSIRRILKIEDSTTKQILPYILLPSELMTADISTKGQVRQSVSFDELPAVLTQALLATEDRRFYRHSGIDPRGIVRAMWRNLRRGRICEGGSTLTQQLVKNHFLTPERTWKRKVIEALMAVALERRLSKQQLITLYCDRVYLGHSGLNEVYGFKQGAQVWFGKKLSDLTVSEAALLVGLVKAPNRYSPNLQAEAAIMRRNTVLKAMTEVGYLTPTAADIARCEKPVLLAQQALNESAAPHFIDYLKRELAKQTGEEDVAQLRVDTTLDLDLQQAATEAITHHLNRLTQVSARKKNALQPEAALIALDPKTGEILAMVGGRDYVNSQLNRITDARRQPGSLFKPIVYAAALQRGLSPTTTFLDAPQEFEFGLKAIYRPQNYGHSYSGQQVTLREGIIRSLNVVAVEAAQQVGLGTVADFADRAGLPRPETYPSMALGAFEATPLEVARAYTVFANQGTRVEPRAVRAITSNGYREETTAGKTSVLPASLDFVVTDTLAEVVNRGTASYIRRAGYKGAVAGKTGTSRDAWFAGYTPSLLVVVWVGYDDHRDLGLTGGEAAVPIWTSFMQRALQLRPDLAAARFAEPNGIETVEIDPQTGMLADKYCPRRAKTRLPSFLVPTFCTVHYEPYPVEAYFQQASSVTEDSIDATATVLRSHMPPLSPEVNHP